MRVLVTGGGTGGHVAPALAVIGELRRRDPDIVITYVGSEAGIEARLAREAGVAFVRVAVGKMRRSSKGLRGLITKANIRDACRVPIGVWQARKIVRTFRPDVVLATGGYVCVPTVIAAGRLRVPILTHEQTVTIGLANRIASRYATRIAVTFEDSIEGLPAKQRKKAFVTGNVVRPEIFGGDRARAVERFGFDPGDDALPCVYVTGGVQGSRIVNHAVRDALPSLLGFCRVLHQCGLADIEELVGLHTTMNDESRRRWVVRPYVESEEIGDAFALADVVLGRAGAGTVADVSALGKPAVFVPLEPTSGDEQRRNAQRSADAGAAVVIPQRECSAEMVLAALRPLLNGSEAITRRAAIGQGALGLATPDALNDLTDALVGLYAGR